MSKRVSFYAPAGDANNPEPRVVVTMLGLVGENVDIQDVEQWTGLERLLAYDYAMRVHLGASDNPIRQRPIPSFVRRVSR